MEPVDSQLVALLGANLRYLDEVYEKYQSDPAAVEPSFGALLRSGGIAALATPAAAIATAPSAPVGDLELRHKVAGLIAAYRRYGHLGAQLDPLDLARPPSHPELALAAHGFGEADLDRSVPADGLFGFVPGSQLRLRELLARLTQTYSGFIGIEVGHIDDPERRRFMEQRLESGANKFASDRAEQVRILSRLTDAEALEQFIHTKYVSAKRFSLEGGKSLIPLLDYAFEFAGAHGVQEVVIGMAHRGRLNVLANLMGKDPRLIFAEFEDLDPQTVMGAGDVKYHMGYSTDHKLRSGGTIHLSLAFNPSHLEAVDPVVLGRVRAKQRRLHDEAHTKVLGVLVHGDAAFAGQGLVAETLNLSGLDAYETGGTLHVIVNNQIGFTTNPRDSRSTMYCTDIAKMLQVPVLHVNGSQPEAVLHAVDLSMQFLQQYRTDVIIDMVCYRRYGHNESDEPGFTQPVMYQKIEKMPSVRVLYARSLMERGIVTQAEVDGLVSSKQAQLEAALTAAKTSSARPVVEAGTGVWTGYVGGTDASTPDVDTAVPLARLQELAQRITQVPADFTPHPKIERLLQQRAVMGRGESLLDWGMGEALAFGSLLSEQVLVRMTGQDSRRGTFSQRHAVLYDRQTGKPYTPLCNLSTDGSPQGSFQVYDSMLSEAAVLGFEYGYSLDYPDGLVLWEAQFGDFVNGAQVLLDQFVSSAEDKWRRLCGLVLLLPHGYEGQGPEHSSARFERFLQLAAEDNIQVCYPTTPAQYFHMLRRQVLRPWRKPLVVMTPKSLLRAPLSQLSDLATGRFQCVIGDAQAEAQASSVKRIMLCTGKVYFDLVEARKKRNDTTTAIVRIEQVYPLRLPELLAALAPYTGAHEVIWVQEEPANMGALSFVMPRLQQTFGATKSCRSVSRVESASPATGSYKAHLMEQQKMMTEAFDVPAAAAK